MSLYRDETGHYRSTLLDTLPWLRHSFGTAHTPFPAKALLLKQVHSADVVLSEEWVERTEADALVTTEPRVEIGVKTADCVPILLADPATGAVAAVHAGWRGTVANIAGNAVRVLRARYGVDPAGLYVALGPAIRACCFEVGAEVAVQFTPLLPERDSSIVQTHVDLIEANRRQLIGEGVDAGRIDWEGPCTVCGGAEFHSWRRDRQTGARMYAIIERLG